MATAKLILDTRSIKKDGIHPVKLYISHRGEDFFMSTGVSVPASDWCDERNKPTRNKVYNSILNQILVQAQMQILQWRADGTLAVMDRSSLKRALSSRSFKATAPDRVITLVADRFGDFIASSKTQGTRSIYSQTLAKLSKYYDVGSLCLTDITSAWLRHFEDSMLADGLSINAIGVHMRNLRSVFNRAIDDDVVGQDCYPFRKFKIKTERTRKRSLSIDQLRTLRDYDCQEHQTKYRDIFMLRFYLLGINAVDLFRLKEVVDGRIEYHRAKTSRLYSIEMPAPAQQIIDHIYRL